MATENEDNPSARRLRLRRTPRAGGFRTGGASGSTSSESLRQSSHEEDEVDDAIDPDSVGEYIERRAALPPSLPEDNTPARRIQQVAQAGSRSWAKEHRLVLLHRLLNRNIGLDKIAQQLGVSISTVEKDRVELKQRLREAARELNIDEMIGSQVGLYEDVSGMALRIASDAGRVDPNTGQVIGGVPTAMRLAGMRTALAANADKTRFLQSAGVFDVLRFRRSEEGDGVSDIQMLMENTKDLLASLQGLGNESMLGGFDDFSMDDGGDAEEMEL